MSATATVGASGVSRRAPRPSFAGAFRGEVLKLSRQRSLWALLIGGTLLLLVVSLAIFGNDSLKQQYQASQEHFWVNTLNVLGTLFDFGAGIVLLISSSRLFGMEYSSGTIRVLLARGLGRVQLYVAKVAALLLLGIVLLAGFSLIAAGALEVAIHSWTGGGIGGLDPVDREYLQVILVLAALSIGITILLGSAAAIIGRSLAFGIGVAMGFFPADNFGTLILYILQRITKLDLFSNLTAYLLGPNLNVLPSLLDPSLKLRPFFATPFVTVTAQHAELVIAVYALAFLVVALVLVSRRDVLE
ncbi:MAG TPA: ABC transporter permease [Candidatus Dormibacteraeota bacterium]|nr:ABC transporter permease [Candidatus Dormibacteraeota bacterium]